MSRPSSEEENFNDVYEEIRSVLPQISTEESGIKDAFDWLDKVLQYNVNYGKKTTGRLLVTSFQFLVKFPDDSDLKIARVLGWCVEMLRASFHLIADFITQRSFNSHGRQSWHLVDGIGILSVNDAVFLFSIICYIIKMYTEHKPYYKSILELLQEIKLHRVIGQRMNLSMCPEGQVDWKLYTMTRYMNVTSYNSASNSFYLPVACAMYMAGITDEVSHSMAKKILIEIGQLAHIQDGYENCFAVVPPPRGWGTDIKDHSCTWMIVRALELTSGKMKIKLQTSFSQKSDLAVKKVISIYKSLDLQTEYAKLMQRRLLEISKLIYSNRDTSPELLFHWICEDLFPGWPLKSLVLY